MLKDNKDQQLFVKITLRELFVYLIFLFIISYGKFMLLFFHPWGADLWFWVFFFYI